MAAKLSIPLPRHWPRLVQHAILSAIGLERLAHADARAALENSPDPRAELLARLDRAVTEIVHDLHQAAPHLGRRKKADILLRAGVQLAAALYAESFCSRDRLRFRVTPPQPTSLVEGLRPSCEANCAVETMRDGPNDSVNEASPPRGKLGLVVRHVGGFRELPVVELRQAA